LAQPSGRLVSPGHHLRLTPPGGARNVELSLFATTGVRRCCDRRKCEGGLVAALARAGLIVSG
jgi:hypothetical protein